MKKFTAIFAAIVLALFVVSCGGSSKKDNEAETPDGDAADSGEEENDGDDEGGDTEATGEKCKLGDLLTLDTPADRYVAFKGSGVINPAGAFEELLTSETANPAMASLVGVDYAGIPDASFQYASQLSLYEADDDAVQLTAIGGLYQQRYLQTMLFISVPFDYLEYMKENEVFDLPQSTMAQLIVRKYSADSRYVGQCVYASKVVTEGSGQYIPGKMRVCYEKNKTFGAGETFKLNMVSEIGSDAETEALFSNLDKACSCYDNDKIPEDAEQVPEDAYVDCDTIDWNAAPADDKCEDPNAEKNANGECECKDGFEKNEETKKCEKKEEEVDPCKDVKCETEGDVCVADATVADKGYRCEPKAECKEAENEVLNEKTNKCDCKDGFERNEETKKCEKKEDTPANPDKEACENAANGGTWENNTCNCGTGKTWNAADKACKADAPANPDKEACENAANGGTWENNTCNCGADKMWNETDKTCDTIPTPNPAKEACEDAANGGTWDDVAETCDCGTDKTWDDSTYVCSEAV